MRNKTMRKAAAVALSAMLLTGSAVMSGCGRSYEHTFGELEWRSTYKTDASQTETKTIKDTYYYSDDWFSDDPSSENPELALASMQLVATCVSDDAEGSGAGFLKDLGFEETGFVGFDSSDPDDASYTWAKKTLSGGESLVAVVIRSAWGENKEKNKRWKQNVTVNDPDSADPSGEHFAYAKAADSIVDGIAALSGGEGTRFWITGQSRGGAIANLLAARLPEKADGAEVFAYTFESPATVDEAAADGNYKYIHNYVCSDDIVTLIPVWGMTRYGVTHDLKTDETDEGLKDALAALGSDAAELNARIVTGDVAAALAENFGKNVPARADYSKQRTDKWTDAEGKSHELTYSYQEGCAKLMDLVFREDSSVSLMSTLAGSRSELRDAIDHLTEGVRAGSSGGDAAAEYWEGAKEMYAVLAEAEGGKLPLSEEDLYKAVRFLAPVLITIPEGGGDADTELLTDVIGYSKEITYSHQIDTIIARLKILAPAPEK